MRAKHLYTSYFLCVETNNEISNNFVEILLCARVLEENTGIELVSGKINILEVL